MLEDRLRQMQSRVRGTRIAPLLKRYSAYLVGRGHAVLTYHDYVRAAEHFWRWLGQRSLSRAAVQRFMRHLPGCRCPIPVIRSVTRNRPALNHILAMHRITPAPAVRPRGFVDDLLQRYEEGLVRVRALAAGTVHKHLVLARRMLGRLGSNRPVQLAKWTPERIADYVSNEGGRYTLSTAKAISCAARSLLRFLSQEGLVRHDLAAAVPSFAYWRLASLPRTLQDEELIRLVNAADVRTSIGLRDRAIVLCLSELGLRSSDVAGLTLGGVDFRSGTLTLRRSKQCSSTVLPMTRKLTRALQAYLQHGRPACKSQAVFVLHRPPVGRPIAPATVKDIVVRLADRAKLSERINGAHVLRHSFACRMLRAGASLKQIADLLGHKSIDTTTVYAKVDMNALSRVALPWPRTAEVQ